MLQTECSIQFPENSNGVVYAFNYYMEHSYADLVHLKINWTFQMQHERVLLTCIVLFAMFRLTYVMNM